MLIKRTLLAIATIAMMPGMALAQIDENEFNLIEEELVKEAPQQSPAIPEARATEEDTTPQKKLDFSGLGELSPFGEISVIQRRYLPKTERFQLFAGATMITNDPFFVTAGAVFKGSYFINESWAVELSYFGLTTANREVTDDIFDNINLKAESLVYSKSFIGADVMWFPIYGKLSWFNNRIVPFDLYFSAGYGSTELQSGESAGTLHLAAGQIFAITKATAFRWDFSWNFFQAKGIGNSTSAFNNLFLTVGLSWFFPEAKYR